MKAVVQQTKLGVYTGDREARRVINDSLQNFNNIRVETVNDGIRKAIDDPEALKDLNIVMVDISGEVDPLLAVRELIDVSPPTVAIIAMGAENDIRLYRTLLDAGVNDYLFTPLHPRLVTKCLRDSFPDRRDSRDMRKGKSVVITGVRGGCGASTLAVRLAWELSHNPPKAVLLADLDLKWGDMALQCDRMPNEAVFSLLMAGSEIDELSLSRSVVKIDENLDLLSTLAPIGADLSLTRDMLGHLFERATAEYRYVVAEIPPDQLFQSFPLDDSCEVLVLVSDTRPICAREIVRWRQWLANQQTVPTVLHVLNMAGARNGLTASEFTAAVGVAPDIIMPRIPNLLAGSVLGFMNHDAYKKFEAGLGPLISRIATAPPTQTGLFGAFSRFISGKATPQ